jgi:biopolymer transport protein TolR
MGAALTPSGKRTKQPEPDINVTPLVDVVLVLLIIFMVIAPALEHGERVELPAVFQPDKKQKGKLDPITVTIAYGEKLYYEKEPVDMVALQAKLTAIHTAEPDRRMVLKGDGSVPYVRIREVFAMAQATGFPGIALVVSKKGKGGDSEEES